MGSRLFRTLVGVGISLGVTSAGCWGQSRDADATDATADAGDSGGSAEATSAGAVEAQSAVTDTTLDTTGDTGSATVGATNSVGGSHGNTTGISGGAGGSGSSEMSASSGIGGGEGGNGGSGGADPGAAGQGGDGFDPFCDTSWPTTKGNPPVPECVDPDHACQDEPPLRCYVPTGEFTCDGAFGKTYAPFCVNGSWQCESGLVSATECKCFTWQADDHVCSNGAVPAEEHP